MTDPRSVHDAILVLSFGGPEGPADVMPFLENVTRGRGIPRERLLEVEQHYLRFGGVSPINAQNRAIVTALEGELDARGIPLPVYFGNRNWHPLVGDTVRQMADDGVRRPLVFVTSAFGSYSGCRQYREDLAAAAAPLEEAPSFALLRRMYDHPTFVAIMRDRVREALSRLASPETASIVFTAHSIPLAMVEGSPYVAELRESARLILAALGRGGTGPVAGSETGAETVAVVDLAWQSRSGPPSVPWLEPDIGDRLDALAASGVREVCVVPLGFLSDHVEVIWDLDHQARARADTAGLGFARATTASSDPRFAGLVAELVEERVRGAAKRRLSTLELDRDCGLANCCPPPVRRGPPR